MLQDWTAVYVLLLLLVCKVSLLVFTAMVFTFLGPIHFFNHGKTFIAQAWNLWLGPHESRLLWS